MSWSVVWVKTAEDQLADVWLTASDRAAVTRAASLLDQRFEGNPEYEGESRPNGRRIAFEEPLGIRFEVLPAERLVRVLHVWRY